MQEEKDILLDNHKLIKGKKSDLTDEMRKLFLSINETDYGFDGITKNTDTLRKLCPSAIVERATVEDIMLAYIGGKKQ